MSRSFNATIDLDTNNNLTSVRARTSRHFNVSSDTQPTRITPLVKFENCTEIPKAPIGISWPEEMYQNDPEVQSVLSLVDPAKSRIWIEGDKVVHLGDTVKVKVILYDGFGNRRTKGGDLVRVWTREKSKGASSRAYVIDHQNGSYTAKAQAFWEGQPEIVAAIIAPREVNAIASKRRLICPPVLMNTAIFELQHVVEETPCNYDNQVSVYKELCNFTAENHGRPWFCGKPRHSLLSCEHWTKIYYRNLWFKGYENQLLSNTTKEIIKTKHTASILPNNLMFTVQKGPTNQSVWVPEEYCSHTNYSWTWNQTGFLYNNKWNLLNCRPTFSTSKLDVCLRNTTIRLIGDSTLRQMCEVITKLIPCQWITGRCWLDENLPAICKNMALNFTLTLEVHPLPFCIRNTTRNMFKSFSDMLNENHDAARVILVLHIYAHFLNYHSHVFYETAKDMKRAILDVIESTKNTKVVIKGPHAFAFSKREDHNLWKPDLYADAYQEFLYNLFSNIKHKIIYLNNMDMSISTEQSDVHVEDYLIREMVENVVNYVCE